MISLLATRIATPVLCDSRCQVSFYISQIGPALKLCEVLKYYDQGCLKSSVFISTCTMVPQVSGKGVHLAKKGSCVTKLPISKV